jgi:hypothetical protein
MTNHNSAHALTTPPVPEHTAQRRLGLPAFLAGRKGSVVAAVAVGILALLAGWTWLGTAAVLPLLYTLPCAAMMAMCMKGQGGTGNTPRKPDTGDASDSGGSR